MFKSLNLVLFLLFTTLTSFEAHAEVMITEGTPDATPVLVQLAQKAQQAEDNKTLDQDFGTNNITDWLLNQIAKLNVSFCAQIPKINFKQSAYIGIKYCYEVEPSFSDSQALYSRYDQYPLTLDSAYLLQFKKGNIEGVANAGLLFVRQFPSQKDAFIALPYFFDRLPYNADIVKEKLKPGDYASFNTNGTVTFSLTVTQPLPVHFQAQESIYYLFSGGFQVNIFKSENNKVNIKFISLQRKKIGGSVGVGIQNWPTVISVSIINRQIVNILNDTNVFFNKDHTTDNSFMAEYNLDLNTQEGVDAYNQVMQLALHGQPTITQDNVATAAVRIGADPTPVDSNEELMSKLSTNLNALVKPLDDIYLREEKANIPTEKKIVDRNFEGILLPDADNQSYGVNLLRWIFSWTHTDYSANIPITLNDSNNHTLNYVFYVDQTNTNYNRLFSLDSSTESSDLHALFNTTIDPKTLEPKIIGFQGMGLTYEYKPKNLDVAKMTEINNQLKQTLPPEIYSQIDWGSWDFTKPHINAHIRQDIVFKTKALLDAIPENMRNPEAIQNVINNYLSYLEKNKALPTFDVVKGDKLSDRYSSVTEANSSLAMGKKYEIFALDVQSISENLLTYLSSTETSQNRKAAYDNLFNINLFKQISNGILFRLVSPEKLSKTSDVVYVNLDWSADDVVKPAYLHNWGTNPYGTLYEITRYILTILQDTGFDINFYKDLLPKKLGPNGEVIK